MNWTTAKFFILFATASCILHAADQEDPLARRVESHLTVRDFPAAVFEAQQALAHYPQSVSLHEGYIRALARMGDERRMLSAWESYIKLFPDKSLNRDLIEEMAWGVLNKASHSSSFVMRQMALLAAFFSQDAKGVAILAHAMGDSNYAIRAMAVKLAGHLRDHQLKEEVKRLFKNEKVWAVRQKVLEAAGKMKIVSLRPQLEALIASDESLPGEKALAIAALLEVIETINRPEIERLSASNRSGLRQLACRAIVYYQSVRDLDRLFLLSKDPHPDVRLEALQAIGQLRPLDQEDAIIELARRGTQDGNPQVAVSAAWLLTLYAPEEGREPFHRLLYDERREVRALAAAALGASGKYGEAIAADCFQKHPDPYVKLNLALGLIGVRQSTQEAAQHLTDMLLSDKDKWSLWEAGLFQAIMNIPPNERTDPLTTPETDNQLLRLELLNLLAILKAPEAQQAIRECLSERAWEISATAAALLLTEGDESAIDLVKQLLQDPQPRIRLQAALILSLWSREESAIQILEENYAGSDWELKGRILEGVGRIGSMRSVPFLINVLKEPSQTMRLIAAMALIQCLNH